MAAFAFRQLDVFAAQAGQGNPLAVVHGAAGLSDAAMQAFAAWTNLSETIFLLPPAEAGADYRVRIFTPVSELPFAGHPTLGACHAWLEAGGKPARGDVIIQECGAGLIELRRRDGRLAFAAPALAQEEIPAADHAALAAILRLPASRIRAARRLAHLAPRWVGVLLESRDELLSVKIDRAALGNMDLGLVAPWPGGEADFEVRAFAPEIATEDPVTGSLNAGLARWLIGAGLAPPRYVAAQGTVLGRAGRVHVAQEGAKIWIGGDCVTVIEGWLTL